MPAAAMNHFTVLTDNLDKTLTFYAELLDLPMKERNDPLFLEAAALQLSQLGGWPARRRGYVMSAGSGNAQGAYTITSMPHDSEISIGAE